MNRKQDLAAQARRVALQRLQSLQRAGLETLPRAPAASRTSPPNSNPAAGADPTPETHAVARAAPAAQDPRRLLAELRQEVANCTACRELAETRTQTVFGTGNPQARLCFFGEAPGADEDRQGEPFVGRAGKLLTDIIEKGMQLKREDVYILNTLKCRPPGNRNPSGDEVERCRHFFERQFDLIQPEFICCLGSVAAQSLLETKTSIGRLRGQLHEYRGIQVVCTYHPAYLLRNPAAKKSTWEDIQLLMEAMGLK